MKYAYLKIALPAIASGILYGLALNFVQFHLTWICLVPFFVAIAPLNKKKAFYAGGLLGLALFIMIFYWLPKAVFTISSGSIIGAVGTAIIVPAIFAAYFGSLALCVTTLKSKGQPLWLNALLAASVWTIGSYLLFIIFPGMPWFSVDLGNALLDNLYSIQPVVYGGIYLLTFIAVLVNYLFAHFIIQRQWKAILVPFGLIGIFLGLGYFILTDFKKKTAEPNKSISVAIVSGNIPEAMKWNDETGNELANRLLQLNKQALATRPDIVLWPEGIVPWSYEANDDLVQAILKSTNPSQDIYQIIGFNRIDKHNQTYNSALCLLQDGSIAGKHDKHFLVALAERPVNLFSSLFLKKTTQREFFTPGADNGIIPTKKGKVGVLICSELFIPEATQICARNGAEILVSLSDDALFANAMGIVRYQFYKNRLRAVEARKDIGISCNMGISGMINAAGEIVAADHSPDEGYTKTAILQANNFVPKGNSFRVVLLIISSLIILSHGFLAIKSRK